MWAGHEFGRRVVQEEWGNAQAVYSFSSTSLEIFEAAKRAGMMCVLDFATAPRRFESALTGQQAARYEGWASRPPGLDASASEYADRQNRESELADVIICASSFVKNAVEAESGQGSKAVVVPLGLRSLPLHVAPKPPVYGRPLRVLFVGDDAIRKGIGDLCRAIDEFGRQRCEVRIVGSVDLSRIGREQASKRAKLVGAVPRQEMRQQYEWADVCVLPSVSDTFGLVVLEAMSFGVPVITTPNTGGADVIVDGENGFIVPIMSPGDIAERLEILDADRVRLAALSQKAITRSGDFSMDRYGTRLIAAVRAAFERFTLEKRSACGIAHPAGEGLPNLNGRCSSSP
jgi:glycosyltransferase involved in cell wall biosynthesis